MNLAELIAVFLNENTDYIVEHRHYEREMVHFGNEWRALGFDDLHVDKCFQFGGPFKRICRIAIDDSGLSISKVNSEHFTTIDWANYSDESLLEILDNFPIPYTLQNIPIVTTLNTGEMMITHFAGEYAFLSNFWGCEIEYEGIVYPSSEHAFQAAKTDDMEERQKIAVLNSPGKAKRAGRKVKLRQGWNEIRIDVMRDILRIKFSDPDLREKLLATGEMQLVEGNNWGDRYWGVSGGKGENHLGKLLMEIRNEMR